MGFCGALALKTARTQIVLLTTLRLAAGFAAGPGMEMQIARQFDHEEAPIRARAAASDPRGYFWVAADTGLWRFDGGRFHRFDATPVVAVAITPDGWVCAGGNAGLTAFRKSEKRLLVRKPVRSLAVVGDTIFAAGENLWRGSIGGLVPLTASVNGGLATDGRNHVWFACGESVCEAAATGDVTNHDLPREAKHEKWLWAIQDDARNIWAWNRETLLRVSQNPVAVRSNGYSNPLSPTDDIRPALRMPGGRIWLPGYIFLENGEYFAPRPPVGSHLDFPRFQLDHEKNLWAASPGGGLGLFSPVPWVNGWGTSVFPKGCSSINRSGGRLLASCSAGVFEFTGITAQPNGDEWRQIAGTNDGSPSWSSFALADRSIWTILGARGIVHIDSNGVEKEAAWRGARAKGLDFRTLFQGPQGQWWVGAKAGLFRLRDHPARLEEVKLAQTKPWESSVYVAGFARSRDGKVWLGTDHGIFQLVNRHWELAVPREILKSWGIRSIAVSPGPVFWVAYRTARPFSRISWENGKWTRRDFSAEDGYGPAESRSLLADSRGWIWRSTPEGIFVSDGVHLAAEDWVALHGLNNLPGESTGAFAFFEDEDGTVWVAMDEGVAQIRPDPAWFAREPLPAPRVTALRWHGVENLWPAATEVLRNGAGDLRIDFAQWPTITPKPAGLQYRMTPLETEWRAGESGTVEYGNLKPGRYRFETRAREGAVTVLAIQVEGGESIGWVWGWFPVGLAGAGFLGWRTWRGPGSRREYWREKEAFLAARAAPEGGESHLGEVLAGRYQVGEQIGEGGFARIWKARDRLTGNEVAVKFLNVEGEIEAWQMTRFEKETEALRRVNHPGIVRLFDAGVTDAGALWMAIAWVDGPTLREALSHGPLAPGRAAVWIRQMGDAIGEAHSSGVLHRDLKPENILIEHADTDRARVIVVDFGAAAVESSGPAQSALLLGSLDYMAPERVQGRSSTATDIYGLTAIAFEMLTGVRYSGVAAASAEGMRRVLAGFPEPVADLLAAGLAYLPEKRPTDARRFAEKLAAALTAPK